jgi:ubiquitin-associated SH3 domain-containing protein
VSTAELILYATPTGALADQLDVVFERLRRSAPTTAQTYPPHCTLTGFFRRDADTVPRILEELRGAHDDVGTMPAAPVEVVALHRRPDWVGLELRSLWLQQLTAAFVDRHAVGPGDDHLRPKDWLHLSVAYGDGDLAAAQPLVADLDPVLAAEWEVDLWQRHEDGTWTRHRHRG